MSSESEQTTNGAVQETESNPDFSRKHPLERRWTLWYDSKAKKSASSWTEALKPVCTVSTVEEFWCLFNNILTPADLEDRASIFFFLDGVRPDWDEEETRNGGIWQVPIKSRGQESKAKLESYWADAVLHLLGEQFEHSEDICGVACEIRKLDRISLWTKTASDEAIQTSIGKQLKALLKLPSSTTIGFTSHAQARSSNKSAAKEDTYTV